MQNNTTVQPKGNLQPVTEYHRLSLRIPPTLIPSTNFTTKNICEIRAPKKSTREKTIPFTYQHFYKPVYHRAAIQICA